MSTKTKAKSKKIEQKRPQQGLPELTASERVQPHNKGQVDKQFTSMAKAVDGTGGVLVPTTEQLAKINLLAPKTMTEDDVRVFNTWSCNDMPDRDDDRFTTRCIGQYKDLEPPFSSVGKAYMVSHDYTKLPVGRIFDVDVATKNGVKFLKNWVYMLNTEQYAPFLENIDGGIYWAVSVGVMLGTAQCSICQSQMYQSSWFNFSWCEENGHEKGLFYDPDSDETDEWGWAIPVDPESKGAVKCLRDLEDPSDFYELSQCFLGAQFDAQIAASLDKGILKAASKGVVNLSHKQAESLPIQHVDERVAEAYRKGLKVKTHEDGTLMWKDEQDLVWVFDPEADEDERVMSLGKAADDDTEEGNDGEDQQPEDGTASGSDESGDGGVGSAELERSAEREGDDEEDDADEDEERDGGEQRQAADVREDDDEGSDEDLTRAAGDDDEDDDEDDADDDEEDEDDPDALNEDDTDDESGEDEDVDKATVLAMAAKAKLSSAIVDKIHKAKDNGLSVLVTSLASAEKQVKKLNKKAALGDEFVKAKRAEAIDWYVKAHQDPRSQKPVSTDKFVKMLDRFGDDVELIEEVAEEHKKSAQEKFSASGSRRSVAHEDHNEADGVDPVEMSPKGEKAVASVHG